MIKNKRRRRPLTPFGMAVKKAALDKDMTLAELAHRVGISPQYINHIIHGARPGRPHRPEIVRVLGLAEKWIDAA